MKSEMALELQNVTPEEKLIRQCHRGDKHAFGALVTKYMKRAYFIALGLVGSHENALDLSQEAFVRAYRSIHKLDVNRKFFTWYYQILRNLCYNFLRDQARHASPFSKMDEAQLAEIEDRSADVSAHLEQEELQRLLWQALDELKPPEREIIVLKDFQNMSYQEIAGLLNCPKGTVMSRLYTARQALKCKMEVYLHE
jgi:RNA polymerase sigma-70 factor (ECF subfamily)